MVARAIEGAAPKSPAKLLGFSKAPSSENAETTSPPTMTLKTISFTHTCPRAAHTRPATAPSPVGCATQLKWMPQVINRAFTNCTGNPIPELERRSSNVGRPSQTWNELLRNRPGRYKPGPGAVDLSGFLVELNQNLGVALDAFIELLIRFGGFVDWDAMADNLAGLCLAVHNQISKIFVVLLYRSLPAAHGQPLIEEFRDCEREDSLFCRLILSSGIRGHVNADHSQTSRWIQHAHTILQYLRGLFFFWTFVVMRLIANSINRAIDSFHLFLARPQALLNTLVFLS